MVNMEKGKILRIFLSENEKYEGTPLFEWIVNLARKEGMAGATVWRGMEGFGSHCDIHKAHLLSLSDDLPVVIEIIDEAERVEKLINAVDCIIKEGLITVQDAIMKFYRPEE